MLRVFVTFIVFLMLFTGITFALAQKPGFAIFNYGEFYIEIPLVKFSAGIFIFIVIFYALYKFLSFLYNAPSRIQSATKHHKEHKAINDTNEGLIKYVLGDWPRSEKLLLRGAKNFDGTCINYMWAAHAAHNSGEYENRDKYIEKAMNCKPSALAALNVLKAEFLLDQGLPEQALASLSQQTDQVASNPKIAKLITLAYLKLNDWDKLFELLPKIESLQSLDKHSIEDIKRQTALGLLRNSRTNNTSLSIENISSQFEYIILSNDELTITYIEALRANNNNEKAISLTTNLIDKKWDSKLVRQYGLLHFKSPSKALTKAEKWIDHHTDDAYLYLTLGRLSKSAKLWGKAKAYFGSSLSRKPLAETYAELASLHEQLNEIKEAARCAKKGLKLATKIG